MSTWTQRLYEDLSAGRIGPAGSPVLAGLVEGVHALVVLFRETVRDRLHVRAAMLAYWTAVAMVPILLLGFALTGPLGLGLATREAVKGVRDRVVAPGELRTAWVKSCREPSMGVPFRRHVSRK